MNRRGPDHRDGAKPLDKQYIHTGPTRVLRLPLTRPILINFLFNY